MTDCYVAAQGPFCLSGGGGMDYRRMKKMGNIGAAHFNPGTMSTKTWTSAPSNPVQWLTPKERKKLEELKQRESEIRAIEARKAGLAEERQRIEAERLAFESVGRKVYQQEAQRQQALSLLESQRQNAPSQQEAMYAQRMFEISTEIARMEQERQMLAAYRSAHNSPYNSPHASPFLASRSPGVSPSGSPSNISLPYTSHHGQNTALFSPIDNFDQLTIPNVGNRGHSRSKSASQAAMMLEANARKYQVDQTGHLLAPGGSLGRPSMTQHNRTLSVPQGMQFPTQAALKSISSISPSRSRQNSLFGARAPSPNSFSISEYDARLNVPRSRTTSSTGFANPNAGSSAHAKALAEALLAERQGQGHRSRRNSSFSSLGGNSGGTTPFASSLF